MPGSDLGDRIYEAFVPAAQRSYMSVGYAGAFPTVQELPLTITDASGNTLHNLTLQFERPRRVFFSHFEKGLTIIHPGPLSQEAIDQWA